MQAKRIWGTAHPFFEDGPVFGRKMANASFLAALLRRDPFDEYHFFLSRPAARNYLSGVLTELFPALWEAGRLVVADRAALTGSIRRNEYACFHLSDWAGAFVDLAIARNALARNLFPITAPVHSLSYARYGAAFLRHLWPGASPRDVIVASSRATQEVIEGYFSQLAAGYGLEAAAFPGPQVRRIPLGVEAELFAAGEEKQRLGQRERQRLGISPEVTVFLSFSRVSYLSKMDFLPILDAFRLAHKEGLPEKGYHFIIAGRMDEGDPFGEAVLRLARDYGVPFSLLPFPARPDAERRKALFAAADVFISAVDNIQESFGLTVLEAYAASLPVIASAVDGYKELVRQGETGFLIPSVGPASARTSSAQAALLPDDLYHLYFAQQTVVELGPFAEALRRLGTDRALSAGMGRAGRALALGDYSWAGLIERYLKLWEELAAVDIAPDKEAALRRVAHPSHPDFLRIFRKYFSITADDPTLAARGVVLSAKGRALLAKAEPLVVYRLITEKVDRERLEALLLRAAEARPFAELAGEFRAEGEGDRDFLLLWALKHGLLEFSL